MILRTVMPDGTLRQEEMPWWRWCCDKLRQQKGFTLVGDLLK